MGLIVRTAGCNKTKNEIDHDLITLINTWNQIKDSALNSIAPSLIHQESRDHQEHLEICMSEKYKKYNH